HEGYLFALHAIHGFRLQLFFLVSGFFTAMLFRQRGLRGLIKHRAKRILLPLVVFTILLSPAIIGIGIYGSTLSSNRGSSENIWAAAKSGDVEAIQQHLAKGADPSQADPAGLMPLSWAALLGQTEAARALIEAGADLEATDNDGSTALHCAAFMGEADVARLLVENGADINAVSNDGGTP
ncbi:MAG: ankyrin repeat domain-containing protein, partial [Myxococcota bacterium]|nr:ankyrin repeat domain-containing protein [Myxococcota bacterium]